MASIDLSVHMKGIAQDGYMNQLDHSNENLPNKEMSK